ncbi:MAG: hypothetical protein H0U95_10605 [Bacteroidetes bacterium]|nr:hypothetical protein [Bacteroidota bacterium]
MKPIKLFLLGIIALFFIPACTIETVAVAVKEDLNAIDTITTGCLVSYDINPLDNTEKINQVRGKDNIKDGHWITFGFAVTKTNDNKTNRIKIEEGYYRKNKKIGFWKFYKEDGTLKDSVEYKNDVPLS